MAGASTEPKYSIGQVCARLKREFPAISASKLRFMEDQGIISPIRQANGYRRYSDSDLARLAFALAAQRDSFLPWTEIRQQLEILDRGGELPGPEPTVRVVSRDGQVSAPPLDSRITVRELKDYTGASTELLQELVRTRILSTDLSGNFSARAIKVVESYLRLEQLGVSARHLMPLRTAAQGSTDLIEKLVAPMRARGGAVDRERAAAKAHDLSTEFSALIQTLIQLGVEELN